jgi:hypothetical protein
MDEEGTKITDLTELTESASDDLLVIVDKDDTTMGDSGTDKKIQAGNLGNSLVEGDLVGTSDTQTLTNKTLESSVLNTEVSGTAVLDEDTMTSNSDTKLATQQSIKAYADTKSPHLALTKIASGKVKDATNGVTISVGVSGLYLVFTEGWVASASGKVGFFICSNITGGYSYVDTIKSGTYCGTVTMPSGTTIKIVPYNSDGCIYTVIALAIW